MTIEFFLARNIRGQVMTDFPFLLIPLIYARRVVIRDAVDTPEFLFVRQTQRRRFITVD
jgi:hypothetical protein